MTSAENSISQPQTPLQAWCLRLAIMPRPVTKNLATALLRELHIISEAVSNTRHSVSMISSQLHVSGASGHHVTKSEIRQNLGKAENKERK